MAAYKNLGGDSGIDSYEIAGDSITGTFSDRSVYRYNYASAGRDNIEHMKTLAVAGEGLNAFINTNVKKMYVAKLT